MQDSLPIVVFLRSQPPFEFALRWPVLRRPAEQLHRRLLFGPNQQSAQMSLSHADLLLSPSHSVRDHDSTVRVPQNVIVPEAGRRVRRAVILIRDRTWPSNSRQANALVSCWRPDDRRKPRCFTANYLWPGTEHFTSGATLGQGCRAATPASVLRANNGSGHLSLDYLVSARQQRCKVLRGRGPWRS